MNEATYSAILECSKLWDSYFWSISEVLDHFDQNYVPLDTEPVNLISLSHMWPSSDQHIPAY